MIVLFEDLGEELVELCCCVMSLKGIMECVVVVL